MAGFQTNVFRDGHWRTETVSTQQALDATAKFDASRTPDVQASPPQCGILTRTIVPSPVAHWILPIRIRSRSQIDVAFVGSHSVQISELRSDGQLIDIVRKDDFGSRICNAVVMGDTPNTPSDIVGGDHASAKLEDAIGSYADFSQPTSGKARQLPPQILVLFLTNGQLAFVFLTTSDESWGFEIMQYRTPWAIKNLGFRVAIDPSSRYLAAASSQKAFMIWQLESRENLEEQYKRHGIFNPLKTDGNGGEPRTFQGTLFHLEFLFPRPEDVDHIILMMVVARRDSHTGVAASRVITLDWLAGEDLRTTMQGDMNGIRLPDHYQMPLMIIPIRFKNSMCVVAEHSIGVIRNAISGSMTCDDLLTERPPKTSLYHGLDEPLWCAWARPIRGDWYCKTTDVIILAREDGYLVHIEVDAENVVPSVTSAGCLDSTISTAFAMPYIDDADAIIVGGDSSPGGTWKLSPRTDPVRASTLRNWSPVVDITNAPFEPPRTLGRPSMAPSPRPQTEALVSASGRGLYGNLASFRRGRQARIGTDIDTDSVVRQVGAYTASHRGVRLLHVALSLPESTLVLQFSSDMTEVRALDDEDTNFDLNSRTLRVHNSPDQTVQVTETHITLIVGHGSYNHSLQFQGIARADHATCSAEHVALCSETTQGSLIHSYSIGPGGIISIGSWEVKGEVTCLLFKPDSANHPAAIIVASILEGRPWISMYDVNGRVVISQTVTVAESPFTQQEASDENALFETITGLQIPAMTEDIVDVILGTVWGRLITVRFSLTDGAMSIQHVRKLGKSPVKLFVPTNDAVSPDLLATCDEHVIMLAGYCPLSRKHKRDAMVIPTSDDNTAADVPPVEWISALPPELQIGGGLTPLLLLAGSRLLLAELSNTSKLIPRCLPVEGTPTKVVYTDIWKCFIVGMIQDNRPTIDFIDALTGEVISQPTSAARGPMTYAAGLGGDGDRIMCMDIWQFHKDGQLFPYILVGLQGGNLLTLSARDVDVDAGTRATGKSRVIQYWMRYKRKGNPGQPVYSVHGVEDGMIHCTGTTLHYEVLNPQQKRMIDVSHFELDSPALTLQVREGKLFVLTSRHSLLILDHCNPSTGPDRGRMPLLHADSATRSTIHMVPMRVPVPTNANATITMLADASSNVVGVWTAVGGKHQQIETVFRASLPVPIRRFVQARCRMPWFEQREQGKYGTVRSTTEDLDTFGVALDGALYHFTIIEAELWEMLNFVQDCAEKARSLTILHSKDANGDELEGTRRHINGDVLSRSLESGVLEDILTDSDLRSSLFALLDKIDAGRLTEGFREDARAGERYHDLAYRILEYLDAPVL